MTNYIIRRLILIVPTLVGMTMIVFFIMAWSPGGISPQLLNNQGGMDPKQRKALEDYINKRYGLNRPDNEQYARWLNNVSPIGFTVDEEGNLGKPALKIPNLGHSFVLGKPVTHMIAQALPITLLLNAITIPIVYMISIVTGIYAARHRGKWFDVASGTTLLVLWSVPAILAGVALIGFLASKQYVKWFPTAGLHDLMAEEMTFLPTWGPDGFQRGWLLDFAWHLVLPIVALTYGGFAFLTKLTRGAVLENLLSDYVRTARAKGVDGRTVLFRHVLRNSMIPLITVASSLLPALIGGSVIIETIFGIPGMGKLAIDAVNLRDREVVMAVTLVGGLLGLFSYLIADICYVLADPRVSYE